MPGIGNKNRKIQLDGKWKSRPGKVHTKTPSNFPTSKKKKEIIIHYYFFHFFLDGMNKSSSFCQHFSIYFSSVELELSFE
jgi:hypothetical protein